MTKLYVTEYSDFATSPDSLAVGAEPAVNDQVVDYTAGAAASAAFKSNTTMVRLNADSICSVVFGTAPTATTSNGRLAAGVDRYVSVPVGQSYKVSAITNT